MKKQAIFTIKNILVSCAVVLFVFVIACSKKEATPTNSTSSPSEITSSKPNMMDNAAVTTFLTNYFQAKNSLLLNQTNIADATKRYLEFTNNSEWSITEADNIAERKDVYVKIGVAITKVQSNITVDSLKKIDDNNVTAKISEVTYLTTDAISTNTNEIIVTGLSDVHTVHISTGANGSWTVNSVNTFNPFSVQNMPGGAPMTGPGGAPITGPGSGGTPPQLPLKTFIGSYAANYAIANVRLKLLDPSEPCYFFYTNYFWEKGCTNFISHALMTGGWVVDNTWYSKPDCIGSSNAWAGADPFKRYASSSGRATIVAESMISSLQLGDVISFDFDGNDNFSHTTMVTLKDKKSNIYLTYHTPNTLNTLYIDFIKRAVQQNSRQPTIVAFKLNTSYR